MVDFKLIAGRHRYERVVMGVVFLFGLVVGSFLNVCIHRLPREESIIRPPSHCTRCKALIRPWDNIPVISFLLLRGKCRQCHQKISWRYPLIELSNAAGYLLIVFFFGYTFSAVVYAALFSALLVVTFIDFDHQIIPDEITLPGMVLGLLAASTVLPPGFVSAAIGLLAGGGLFYLAAVLSRWILRRDGMGGGDIKFIAMIGAFLGWRGMLLTIFLGALTGALFGISQILFFGKKRENPIPFGPFLAFGALISLLFGPEILRWYLFLGRTS
jgi:leader peptidase (prepilin peptidase)/N-methyltransferase